MSLTVLRDDVAIRRLPERTQTRSGLHIPQRVVEDAWMRGEVVAVGPGRVTWKGALIPPKVKPGDKVVFAADERKMGGHTYDGLIVVKSDLVVGVLEE